MHFLKRLWGQRPQIGKPLVMLIYQFTGDPTATNREAIERIETCLVGGFTSSAEISPPSVGPYLQLPHVGHCLCDGCDMNAAPETSTVARVLQQHSETDAMNVHSLVEGARKVRQKQAILHRRSKPKSPTCFHSLFCNPEFPFTASKTNNLGAIQYHKTCCL